MAAAVAPSTPLLPAPQPSRTDPASLLTRQDVERHLSALIAQESSLDARLTQLISSRSRLAHQLKSLASLSEVVGGIQGEAEHMAGDIAAVAETADRVGAKVRGLDEEQSRVKECIEMVQAVQEVKTAIASLDIAMQKQDWEAATRCMQRARAIDPSIVSSGFAEAVVPTSHLPSTPSATLTQLRAALLEIFVTAFRTAADANDTNNINRFFKLFPMIEEEEKGLEVYADWVAGIVRAKTGALSTKSQSPTHFSALLTTLFEAIALILSQHQPVVEKYYGEGKMMSVAGSLMTETDRLGLRVLANWEEERRIRKKVADVRDHRFAGAGVLKKMAQTGTSPMTAQTGFDGANGGVQAEGDINPREIDAVLTELTMMSGRWELLRRFLYGTLKDDEAQTPPATAPAPSTTATTTLEADPNARPAEAPPTDEADLEVAENSTLGKEIAKQLKETYMPLELWYLRTAIERAHQMDEPDYSSTPYLSSSLDDIFYIVKKTIQRLVSTAQIDNLVAMNKELRSVLDRDVAEIWRARIEAAFKELAASQTAQSGMAIGVSGIGSVAAMGGRAREEERERREKEARNVFIVYLNNLDTAASYTSRLLAEVLASEALESSFFLFSELERARTSLSLLRNSEEKFRAVLKSGLDHLFNQLVRPKLRPLLSEVYKDVSYKLDEDAYNEAEYRDDVRKRFVKGWDALMSAYRDSLTESTFNLFFSTAVNVLVRPWESMVRGMKFTELGALRLDRDIRTILSYLSGQAPFASGSLRESFSRLQQIATLLTLDSADEAEEVLSASGNRLTSSEVSNIRALLL
ncbi:Golgi transport complex subunit 4 [Rhodotorula toruloides]